MILYRILLPFVFLIGIKAQYPCPEVADIRPCTCKPDDEFRLNFDCSEVQDDSELESAFSAYFPFIDIKSLVIRHTPDDPRIGLKHLTKNTFADKFFDEVIISHTTLESIDKDTFFYSNNSLISLKVTDNALINFPFDMLPLFGNLTTLYLHNNQLITMPELKSDSLEELYISHNPGLFIGMNTFKLTPNIRNLIIQDVGMSQVAPGMFNTLEKLEVLDLSHNLIETLETDALAFPGNTVREIKLNNNQLTSDLIKKDFLTGIDSPCYIFLQHNKLTALEAEIWTSVFEEVKSTESKDLFVFENNPLSCGCEIKWLIKNDVYKNILAWGAVCHENNEDLHNLDEGYFDANCD